MIFVRKISNIQLILYFSHLFKIQHCLKNDIMNDIFFLNKRILLFDSPILPCKW